MGFFDKIQKGLSRTKKNLIQNIESVIVGYPKLDDEFLDDMEAVLLSGDLGLATTEKVMGKIRQGMHEGKIKETGDVLPYMKDAVAEMLTADNEGSEEVMHHPEVILVVGVNGVGKTTTIGKLAAYYRNQGKKVLLAAADTFRAAAGEQLVSWANRAGVEIISGQEGSDPGAVVYDAIQAAKARHADVLLVDTAGRLHNKKNLMAELGKLNRIIEKEYPEAYRETLVVLDGTTGQNALAQAKEFKEVADITGIILTKLDGTAKGGIAVAIHSELGIPVKYIGVGESIDDLQKFDANQFVNALFNVSQDK